MEIERKWMVTGWPEGLPLEEEFTMRQGYISVQPTVRIREEALTGGSTDYILCFKSAGGLAREEIERSIEYALGKSSFAAVPSLGDLGEANAEARCLAAEYLRL